MTVGDLIKSSMRLIRVIASGESPADDMMKDALAVFRAMVDEWFNEDLMLYRVKNLLVTLEANKASYTIGEGFDVIPLTGTWIVGKYVHGLTSGALGYLAQKENNNYIIQAAGHVPTALIVNVTYGAWVVHHYIVGSTSGAIAYIDTISGSTFSISPYSGTFIVGEQVLQYETATSRGADRQAGTLTTITDGSDYFLAEETVEMWDNSLQKGVSSATAYLSTVPDWQFHRPDKIDVAFVRLNTVDYPMQVIYNNDYQSIAKKDLTSNLPLYIYLDTDWPNATCFLYPVPTTAYTADISFRQHFTEFTGLDDVITLPHGYEQALRYNLALELAPEFGKRPDEIVVKRARETKGNIKGANAVPQFNRCDRNLIRKTEKFNFYIG